MFDDINKIISEKRKASFIKKPAQAALVCHQAKSAVDSLIDLSTEDINYKFSRGVLYLFVPHAQTLDIKMILPELQKILDQRLGEAKVRIIKIRAI